MTIDRNLIVQCLAVLAALPLLYVAASGPLLRVNPGHPARPLLDAAYQPLNRATLAVHVDQAWRSYLAWWGGYYRVEVYDTAQFAKAADAVE